MRVRPRAGELQHAAFGGFEFGVVVFDQPGELRGTHCRQLHPRFEHAFNIEEAADKTPISPAWISHGKGMAGVCHQVSQTTDRQAVAAALPNAQRRVLAGQDHGPAPVIVPELVRFLHSAA
jgi:hypothetical protein